jgi:tetratricopeptide (TPR) repeat protein/DNA-binding Xre family transcriptional regulator
MTDTRSLRAARLGLSRPLTQKQLADFAGVSLSTIERAERGDPIRIDCQQRICTYLNKTPQDLGFQGQDTRGESKKSPSGQDRQEVWYTEQEERLTSSKESDQMDRRQALQALGGLSASLLTPSPFGLTHITQFLHNDEVLSLCATQIPICWRLYFDGHLSTVHRVLPDCLSPLAVLVRQPSPYQTRAASLASQAHQLACMLSLQGQDYGTALIHADQALFCARIAEDVNLQVVSLIRRANIYRFLKRPQHMMAAYQEAAQYRKNVSPLLQGRFYMGLAQAHSELLQENEAFYALEEAYKIFPANPQSDPHYSYTYFKLPQHFEALVYLNLKQPAKAWEGLTYADKSLPMAVVPDRLDLSIDQVRAALLSGNIEQCCAYLDFAVTSATMLGSQLRYHQSYDIYQHMLVRWHHEPQVKVLADLFVR